MNDVKFMISEKEDLASVQGPGLITQELLCSRGTEKVSDIDFRREMENAPFPSLSKGIIYFLIGY